MANKKINDLTLAGSVTSTMQFETDIGGATANKVTALQLDNYFLTGKAGGRTFTGGSAAGENLVLSSTSNAIKGEIQTSGENFNCGVGSLTADHMVSTVTTGTAPFTITSTTKVSNLNVDQLDGYDESAFALLAGRAGGQILIGGTGAGQVLRLTSTSHATNGVIEIDDGDKLISMTTNYETLVVNDNDFPNKRYVDDALSSAVPAPTEDVLPVTVNGQTIFALSLTPVSNASFALFVNGVLCIRGTDYTQVGTVLTWLNPVLIGQLKTTDTVIARYNNLAVGFPVDSVFGRVGAVIAVAGDYNASKITNDSGVSGAYVKDALNTLNGGKEPTLTKGNLTETTSSVLTVTGGTNAVIGAGTSIEVKQSSSSQNGYLSSTDWSTFNTKEPALTKGNLTEAGADNALTITNGSGAVIGAGTTIQIKNATKTQKGINVIKTKSFLCYAETSSAYGNRRVRDIAATANQNLNFHVPSDFTSLESAYIICYPTTGAAGSSRNIDLNLEYTNGSNQSYQQYTSSDTTTTYDLTGYTDKRYHIPITSLLTNIAAGTDGGVNVQHTAIGGAIHYIGIMIEYI